MGKQKEKEPHFYGGQAVMEGVMMRGKTFYSMAVRKPSGEITTITKPLNSRAQKVRFFKLPVIRGIIAFGSAMSLGMKTLSQSADIAMEGMEEEPTKFEKFLQEKLGGNFLIYLSLVLGIGIAVSLFIMLPLWLGGFVFSLIPNAPDQTLGVIEGFFRLAIFILYVLLISRSNDIKRVFAYHGAEHKTINAHENQSELSEEAVQKFSRLHNRCGTSFLLVVMFISILVFAFVRTPDPWLRMVSRLVLIPFVAGLSYEVIRWAGRSKSPLVKIISAPGLLLQRMTTKEPDIKQVETAICALKAILRAEEPDKYPPEEEPEEVLEAALSHDA